MTERIWIRGSSDPEMEATECLLREAGEHIIYALGPDGQRVRADSAYRVAALSEPIPAGATVYRIECDGPVIPTDAVVIDHHRPGDPGYGRPPAEFLPASSLGQVLAVLAARRVITESYAREHGWRQVRRTARPEYGAGWNDGALAIGGDLEHGTREYTSTGAWVGWFEPPPEINCCAAADHCLAAAYRGECPGVDPDALMRWRAESRAAFQRRAVEDVLADVERARVELRAAPLIDLDNGATARDLRGQHVPELPEASAREGECFIADGLPGRDGRVKVVCQSGTPEQIEAFMRVWAPEHGLVDVYGDPARGFAGGYVACE